MLVQSLRSMILGTWSWQQIKQKLESLRRVLTCHPQARLHQESTILRQLDQILAGLPAQVA